ncbi:MAG: methyl-accepting chemotaxis protein [Synergistaceae bacterium]|jgi:methyl-accepting chemotaxis protein|nr:methyl-accepting chemotaxis protein [Synergistaceae bacterium]
MLRNFRMASKLMLGFGALLLVFMAAVFITWTDLNGVRAESVFLGNRIVPALRITGSIESAANDVFLTVRETRFIGTEETMKEDDELIAVLEKSLADMEALGVAAPEMSTPKMTKEKVLPIHKNYINTVTRMHDTWRERNRSWAELVNAGNDMTAHMLEAMEGYYKAGIEENDQISKVQRVEQLHSVGRVYGDTLDLRRQITAASSANDPQAVRKTKETCMKLEKLVQTLEDATVDQGRKALMKKVFEGIEIYLRELDQLANAMQAQNEAVAAATPLMKSYNKSVGDLATFAEDTTKKVSEENIEMVNSTVVVLFSAGGISILLGLLIAFSLSRVISKPLNTIVGLAQRCKEGDLTITRKDFGYEGRDELGRLADAISDMVTAENEAMTEMVTVAAAVGAGAETLSAIAEETNSSMQEVKASIDQVSVLSQSNGAALQESNAGVEEMSAGADTVAQSSTDSAAFISQTTEASRKAIDKVNAAIDGMRNADRNSRESESKIRQLVESVANVSNFVSVITGIADQTNLLALNAAIEAARAGDVGRGFAVVAEEVRKLAEESAKAAQNVNGIIGNLQIQAQESIQATTEAGRALSDTLTQAAEAQKQLDDAMKEINKANDSIQNIAAVAQEQAASSKEVAGAIDKATRSTVEMAQTMNQIHMASEGTVKVAQNVAEQAEAMTGHAESLTEALSRFTLKETSERPARKEPGKVLPLKAVPKQKAR